VTVFVLLVVVVGPVAIRLSMTISVGGIATVLLEMAGPLSILVAATMVILINLRIINIINGASFLLLLLIMITILVRRLLNLTLVRVQL